ncbi:hypothetical protein KM043_012834 [Ampulex compressa]|nr:hypothetical protein KM043_012834 [Ampulex compressa]
MKRSNSLGLTLEEQDATLLEGLGSAEAKGFPWTLRVIIDRRSRKGVQELRRKIRYSGDYLEERIVVCNRLMFKHECAFRVNLDWPIIINSQILNYEQKEEIVHRHQTSKPNDSGMQRIMQIVKPDERGEVSKELQTILNVTYVGGLTGLIVGGLSTAGFATEEFIKNNKATLFNSHLEAKRALQREIIVRFAKGGAKFGSKLAIFCFIYMSTTTCLTKYAGEHSIVHHSIGGGITGLCFKLSLGMKGSIAGTVVGATLGTIGGTLVTLLMAIAGMSLDDYQDRNKKWIQNRETAMKEAKAKNIDTETAADLKQLYDFNEKDKMQKENAMEIVNN